MAISYLPYYKLVAVSWRARARAKLLSARITLVGRCGPSCLHRPGPLLAYKLDV